MVDEQRKMADERRKMADERRSQLAWLSLLEPEDDFERYFVQRHPGTGLWLLESVHFKEWLDDPKHCLLWCRGPGTLSIWTPSCMRFLIRN
jgi:hypothetical protein